ncbi:MAG TPA: SDR family oxidoreductase [Burkholderiales bacterium]|nr:SDR family oxidoreductase [Burkholderiales bacterium]
MSTYERVLTSLRDRPRTWVVTGVAGFIGSNLLEALLRLDQRVVGLDNFSTGRTANLAQVKRAVTPAQWASFRLIHGDIGTFDTCRDACERADVVLHHAALASVPHSLEDPIAAHRANASGFLNMLIAARDSDAARFVYASSSAVYGDDPSGKKVEHRTGRMISPYAATKYVNELYADVFARCYALQCVGLRYFNVFGARQDPDGPYAAVIPQWLIGMLRGEPVYINGDGQTVRDFCYIDDVIQANLRAATVEDPEALNQVCNIAAGSETTLQALFEMIRSLLERRCPHLRGLRPGYREFRAGDVRHSQADIAKARRLLGYEPRWSVQEGLARTIDWYAANFGRRRPLSDSPVGALQYASGAGPVPGHHTG